MLYCPSRSQTAFRRPRRKRTTGPIGPSSLRKIGGQRGNRTPTSQRRLIYSHAPPMTKDDMVARARESFGRQAWGDAYAQLRAADQVTPLGLDDLERLALAAFLIGKDAESADVGARAHHESLRLDDAARDRKSTRLNSSHPVLSRMPSSA